MLKMYHRHAESGASAAYWEEFGSEGSLADRVRFCDVDPLRPLFKRYLTPGATMLEGGCGRGQYVAYYTAKGTRVVGLDFARDWLSAIHRELPALPLCAGDVGALPFRDGSFDLYYSGGVVEHFEGGADRALREARRVLKPDGILMMSVPYFSPLRRALVAARRDQWLTVGGPAVDQADANGSRRRFYQYAYTVPEFARMLNAAGLRVVETQGYAILWGLYDVESLRRLAQGLEQRRARERAPAHDVGDPRDVASSVGAAGNVAAPSVRAAGNVAAPSVRAAGNVVAPSFSSALTGNGNGNDGAPTSLIRRLVVAEDSTVPGAGWLVRAGRWACANMMMYVCTPDQADA